MCVERNSLVNLRIITVYAGSINVSGLEFGQINTVYPTGIHKATIVWLHDVGNTGFK